LREPERWRRITARFVGLCRAREVARAQAWILAEGPPKAPWDRFPNIASSVSSGWRQGEGEAYLVVVFWPWWEGLTVDLRRAWLESQRVPDDWRELLDRPNLESTE